MYSNCCCSCSFELEIIKIGQSSHKMSSNNIVNFQDSATILNACTKKSETYWMHHVYIYIYIQGLRHIYMVGVNIQYVCMSVYVRVYVRVCVCVCDKLEVWSKILKSDKIRIWWCFFFRKGIFMSTINWHLWRRGLAKKGRVIFKYPRYELFIFGNIGRGLRVGFWGQGRSANGRGSDIRPSITSNPKI